jgi:signal transduction histidine kinase/DNA-binding response OmpR family regulator
MSLSILKVKISYEHDVVLARQRARAIAELLGFDRNDQVRLATALSEIARNAFQYARGGEVEFLIQGSGQPQYFIIRVTDRGPGIADLTAILEGRFRSATGMGLGILGARRLMDLFHIETTPGRGTTVLLGRPLPDQASPVTPEKMHHIVDSLSRQAPADPFAEIQEQNQELLGAMEELQRRKEQLEELNRELSDTNRGLVALYAELDEKAAHLRNASDLKARFLSNMSHEFRTPLNSMLALSRLLLNRADGDLTPEQEKQVAFIRKAAEDLSALVNDLLDLAKIESGKIAVHASQFEAAALFSALRGMLKPLVRTPEVSLIVEEPEGIPLLFTDEGKVSQILRNLVSNAVKFTERGEVCVSAMLEPDGRAGVFSVADTGIGIAPEDQERIFEEYGQVESPLQRKVRGTGLGLSLSRRLAELLGGRLTVKSQLGIGSTFRAFIPLVYARTPDSTGTTKVREDITRFPVLVIEDDNEAQALYEKFLTGTGFQCLPAYTLTEARQILATTRPLAVILDILIPGENGWAFLTEFKSQPVTRDLPVFVLTVLEDRNQALLLGAEDFCTKPIERQWLLARLRQLAATFPISTVLIVDDEEVSRYLLKGILADTKYSLLEAPGGLEGLRLARELRPDLIFLDLMMPDLSGFEVLAQLRQDERTRAIPVIVVTAKALDEQELADLREKTAAVLPKSTSSPEAALAEIRAALTRLAERRPRPEVSP